MSLPVVSHPVVTILGATGAQGGSVLRNLQKSGKFKLRAVTRKAGDPKAKALAASGVEVVEANFNDKASLVKAFSGSWGLFAMTQFWEPDIIKSDGKLEFEAGKTILTAAQEAKVEFSVVSVLDDVHKASGGRIHVPHFTEKARIEELWRKSGLNAAFVAMGSYFQNFDTFFKPRTGSDGVNEFVSCVRADVGIPWIDIDQSGVVVRTVFENPKEFAGKKVDISSGYATYPQIAEAWSRVHSKPARYVHVPYEVFKTFAGEELTAMFQYFNEFGYFLGRDVSETRKRWPALHDAEGYFRSKA